MYDRTILITGGTGSWGNELVRQLLEQHPKEIRIFSRNEASQFLMKQKFDEDPRLKFIIGDIRDQKALIDAAKDVEYLYHLAALKHVPICEHQPEEALKTNVIGTQNVIEAAIHQKINKVIYISTDKAANPSNFYGMTKAVGERLIISANLLPGYTEFVSVRGGNVLGTNGSVIHVFKKQIETRSQIRITDKEMTRFFLTIQDAIKLLFKATYESKGGEIFVMKMPTCRILDLASVIIESSGKENVEIIENGIRPGEKIDEILLSEFESQFTVCFDDDYYVILPVSNINNVHAYYASFPKAELASYSSKHHLMKKDEIKRMLEKGGFLS